MGRGIGDLLADDSITVNPSSDDIVFLEIDKLVASPHQPRLRFDEHAIAQLTASITDQGILQPLIVRKQGDNSHNYEIIAGERRFRAAKKANLSKIPCIIRDFNDEEAAKIALIENIQRSDLTAIEEAKGYKKLLETYNYTQQQLSEIIHKSRSYIANITRLLQLSEKIQDYVNSGELSPSHARILINKANADELADIMVANNMNVRQAENLINNNKKPRPQVINDNKTAHLLQRSLGLPVRVKKYQDGSGNITITYDDETMLDSILNKLKLDQ